MNTSASWEVALIPTAGLDNSMDALSTMLTHPNEEQMNTPTGKINEETIAALRKLPGNLHACRAADLLESLLKDEVTLKTQVEQLRRTLQELQSMIQAAQHQLAIAKASF